MTYIPVLELCRKIFTYHTEISTIIRILVFGEICSSGNWSFGGLSFQINVHSGTIIAFRYHNSIRVNVCRENGIQADVHQSGKKLSGKWPSGKRLRGNVGIGSI